jgi:hypothetical protein
VRRVRVHRLLSLAAVLAFMAVVLPAHAAAQPGTTSPFAPGLPSAPAPTPAAPTPAAPTPSVPAPTTTSSAGGSGLSSGSAVAIGIGAIVLLAAISVFIWRDARRRAPVRRHAPLAASGAGSRAGSRQRVKPRKLSPAERRRRKRGRAR